MRKINNWLKKQIATLSIAFSNVEKNLLGQENRSLDENIKQERRYLQGTLADSLLHGKVTQEVKNLRWRLYKILKSTNGNVINFGGYDENGNPIYTIKKVDQSNLLRKVKIDDYDDYELELVFDNTQITNSITDTINKYFNDNVISATEYFATNKTVSPINIIREYTPKFHIENYTKKINVRKINETEKLIEFYVTKYPDEYNKNSKLFITEIKKVIDKGPDKINFLEINGLEFITCNTLGSDDFLYYSYKISGFDKLIEFDGYYVIKFKAEIINNGDDILSEYVEKELDKKYENKESKIKRPKDF